MYDICKSDEYFLLSALQEKVSPAEIAEKDVGRSGPQEGDVSRPVWRGYSRRNQSGRPFTSPAESRGTAGDKATRGASDRSGRGRAAARRPGPAAASAQVLARVSPLHRAELDGPDSANAGRPAARIEPMPPVLTAARLYPGPALHQSRPSRGTGPDTLPVLYRPLCPPRLLTAGPDTQSSVAGTAPAANYWAGYTELYWSLGPRRLLTTGPDTLPELYWSLGPRWMLTTGPDTLPELYWSLGPRRLLAAGPSGVSLAGRPSHGCRRVGPIIRQEDVSVGRLVLIPAGRVFRQRRVRLGPR